jgi:hypothetical protein
MIAIPGSASGLVLGFLLASVYGAIFHLIFGGSLRRILLYLAAAWAGFLLGQLVGDFLNLEWFKVGKIHLLSASVGAWALLLAARWLAGQDTPAG